MCGLKKNKKSALNEDVCICCQCVMMQRMQIRDLHKHRQEMQQRLNGYTEGIKLLFLGYLSSLSRTVYEDD